MANQVILLMSDEFQPQVPTTCYECCEETYPDDPGCAAPQSALAAFVCCATSAQRLACYGACDCDEDPDPMTCFEEVEAFRQALFQNCIHLLINTYVIEVL